MVTRGKRGFRFPVQHLNLNATVLPPIPKTYHVVLNDPNWCDAMQEEFSSLIENNKWELVPRPTGSNIVTGKWVFHHKFTPDGALDRYKAR